MRPCRRFCRPCSGALLVMAVASLCTVGIATAQTLPREMSIATFENAEPLVVPMEQVLLQAYKKLGIKVSLTRLPVKRSLVEANNGHYDAELGRVAESEKEAPNLLRIKQPIGEISYHAYVMPSSDLTTVNSWSALKQSGLQIGARMGVRIPEVALGDALTNRIASHEAMLTMLTVGRLDVAIGTSATTRATLAAMRQKNVPRMDEVVEVSPPLQVQSMYHLVHKRHAALVGPLNAVLKKMEADGSIARIWANSARETRVD